MSARLSRRFHAKTLATATKIYFVRNIFQTDPKGSVFYFNKKGPMQAQVISFKCDLKNKAGTLLGSSYNHDVLTISEANSGGILCGLNKNLQNLKKGERRNIALSAEEAYGFYDPKKVILFPRKKLPKTIKKGEQINIVSKTGVQRAYRVLEIHQDFASLDGNHPLAGQDLIFEIETLASRVATLQEIDDSLNPVAQQLLN